MFGRAERAAHKTLSLDSHTMSFEGGDGEPTWFNKPFGDMTDEAAIAAAVRARLPVAIPPHTLSLVRRLCRCWRWSSSPPLLARASGCLLGP